MVSNVSAAQTQPPELDWVADGGLTSPAGFRAGASYAGIRSYGEDPGFDVGILTADAPCTVAGLFTRNAVLGEALLLTRERVGTGRAQALVVNAGNSNCVTGEQGARDARRMAELAAARLGIDAASVLVGSTGVIGRPLPMELVERGVGAISVAAEGGLAFARAMMTTDTRPKQAALRVVAPGTQAGICTVGGAAKGSGMVHPDMATMFAFLTTDAPAEPAWLQRTLREVCDRSLHMLDVDMDTSTCDMLLAFAGGAAGGPPVDADHPAAGAIAAAMEAVAVALARELARDGEGARTLIEVVVEGAADLADARRAARSIASSPLVKTMVAGRDPNWGRVMMAAGRSGAAVDQRRASVWIGEHCALDRGQPTAVDLAAMAAGMDAAEVRLRIDLGLSEGQGETTATAWGCDLTEEYVRINADYTT